MWKISRETDQSKVKRNVDFRATWRTFQPKLKKRKKIHPAKYSLYFRKWNFLTLRLKNFLYLLKRKLFLYFRKWNPALSGLKPQNLSVKQFPKKTRLEKISYILSNESFPYKCPPSLSDLGPQKPTLKKFLICSQKIPNFLETKTSKKSLYFKKRNFLILQEVTFQNQNFFYTFPYRRVKFSNLKYFLIIMLWHFFSFYNIFFYTQQAFVFPLPRDFCNVHDH